MCACIGLKKDLKIEGVKNVAFLKAIWNKNMHN